MDARTSFDLDRFVDAQAGVYPLALAELAGGQKRTHWMWFVFPQIVGLGRSQTAAHFAIRSTAEAIAYLQHPLLGPRLIEATRTVNALKDKTAHAIFGSPDDLKFHSSLTLFYHVAENEDCFEEGLSRYFDGEKDAKTLEILSAMEASE